jgi:hypothetical protein
MESERMKDQRQNGKRTADGTTVTGLTFLSTLYGPDSECPARSRSFGRFIGDGMEDALSLSGMNCTSQSADPIEAVSKNWTGVHHRSLESFPQSTKTRRTTLPSKHPDASMSRDRGPCLVKCPEMIRALDKWCYNHHVPWTLFFQSPQLLS